MARSLQGHQFLFLGGVMSAVGVLVYNLLHCPWSEFWVLFIYLL